MTCVVTWVTCKDWGLQEIKEAARKHALSATTSRNWMLPLNLEANSQGSGLNLVVNRHKRKDKQSPVQHRHPQEGTTHPSPHSHERANSPDSPEPLLRPESESTPDEASEQRIQPCATAHLPPSPRGPPSPSPTLRDSTHRTAAQSLPPPGRKATRRGAPSESAPRPPKGSDPPRPRRPRPSARGSHAPLPSALDSPGPAPTAWARTSRGTVVGTVRGSLGEAAMPRPLSGSAGRRTPEVPPPLPVGGPSGPGWCRRSRRLEAAATRRVRPGRQRRRSSQPGGRSQNPAMQLTGW